MTGIRSPQSWKTGDLAFCIEANAIHSVGDVVRVAHAYSHVAELDFGSNFVSKGASHYLRILTPGEVKVLPDDAEVHVVMTYLMGRGAIGPVSGASAKGNPNRPYALKSLPKGSSFPKVGDWVKSATGIIGKVEQTTGPYAVLEQTVPAQFLSQCTVVSEAEAQRLLALKDIEDARAKLADAERRLQDVDGLND